MLEAATIFQNASLQHLVWCRSPFSSGEQKKKSLCESELYLIISWLRFFCLFSELCEVSHSIAGITENILYTSLLFCSLLTLPSPSIQIFFLFNYSWMVHNLLYTCLCMACCPRVVLFCFSFFWWMFETYFSLEALAVKCSMQLL